MMGEPYATWMTMLGHKRLFQSKGKQPQLYAWANISATKMQQKASLKVLDEAIERMGKPSEAALLRDILKQEYQLPPALVDSMALQPVKPVSAIRPADVESAEAWLKKRTSRKK